MHLELNHFWTAVLFAVLSSVILGIVTKSNDRERLRYGLYCFGCFMVALFGVGWCMHFLHG